MKAAGRVLRVASSPHLRGGRDTEQIMFAVLLALAPATLGAVYIFGLSAALLLLTTTIACVLTEFFYNKLFGRLSTLGDRSAVITGLLLGLVLPPSCPLWMGAVGAIVSMLLGKLIFGGLGANVFNPALVGRAFLQSAFPEAMTTWTVPFAMNRFARIDSATLTPPFFAPVRETIDVFSGATPLAAQKWDGLFTPLQDLFLGTHAGSLGETSAALILAGGLYLTVRRMLDWRVPVAIFATAFVLSGIFFLFDGERYPGPLAFLCSGGLMLGAWFMATDPVTSPLTTAGAYIYGVLIGTLVVVIRFWGGLPEGVMYAILLANAVSPLIDRLTQSRVYGKTRRTLFGR